MISDLSEYPGKSFSFSLGFASPINFKNVGGKTRGGAGVSFGYFFGDNIQSPATADLQSVVSSLEEKYSSLLFENK